jgi:hypothetical protein
MTGVASIFELYSKHKETRKTNEEEFEDPKLEPDPEETIEGSTNEEFVYHNVLDNNDWDTLLDMLQNYDFKKFKPKEPDKPKRRLRVVKAGLWVKEKVLPTKIEVTPLSPLLALNEEGQTPLHVAIQNLAPDRHVLRIAFCEKRAAMIADDTGKLPLHYACLHDRNTQVIDRLIRANFNDLQKEDGKGYTEGHTALWYAVQRAYEIQQEMDSRNNIGSDARYWGIPRNPAEAEWQKRQEVNWAKAKFIFLSYSSRRKLMVESERELLLLALEHAAPPAVIEVCVLAAQGMLHKDPTLASSALKLFMLRDYPIKSLQLLLHHFPENSMESMEAARKILSDNYNMGCRTLPGRRLSFRAEMEKHALEGNDERSLACQEWWDKIRCLLRLCGHGNHKENRKCFETSHLLHAALSNCDTPPSLVQMLMVMKPASIRMPHPFNGALLVHLICRNWKYNLFPQSKYLGVQYVMEMEEPPMEQVLKIILASDATLARKRHRDRLPIHHAVATSKNAAFLDALVQVDRKALAVRDPLTKLYPFQMASLASSNKNADLWAHARYTPEKWEALESEERARAVDHAIEEQGLEQLSTIYLLLRTFPAAIGHPRRRH